MNETYGYRITGLDIVKDAENLIEDGDALQFIKESEGAHKMIFEHEEKLPENERRCTKRIHDYWEKVVEELKKRI